MPFIWCDQDGYPPPLPGSLFIQIYSKGEGGGVKLKESKQRIERWQKTAWTALA